VSRLKLFTKTFWLDFILSNDLLQVFRNMYRRMKANAILNILFTCSCWSLACESLMRSILFWRMRMCFNFMISMAAKCSEVWGCGQDSFPAGRKINYYWRLLIFCYFIYFEVIFNTGSGISTCSDIDTPSLKDYLISVQLDTRTQDEFGYRI